MYLCTWKHLKKKSDEPKTAAIGKKSCRESTYTEFEESTTTLRGGILFRLVAILLVKEKVKAKE